MLIAQLPYAAAVAAVCLPMTLSVLPPAPWSPVEGPRICKKDGEYCFTYDPNSIVAPHMWYRACTAFYCFYGANQSPINIDPNTALRVCSPENRLRYNSYHPVKGVLENDGYFAKFTDIVEQRHLFGVPGFADTGFKLSSIHIHIGKKGASRGTEHIVTGKMYDSEVHMVHSRVDGSGTVAGLAVVAIYLSTTEGQNNDELNKLLDQVETIKEYNGEVCKDFFTFCDIRNGEMSYPPHEYSRCNVKRVEALDNLSYQQGLYGIKEGPRLGIEAGRVDRVHCFIRDEVCPQLDNGQQNCGGVNLEISPEKLLPDPRNYYYYYGSLTTPTLSESVLWQVMMHPIRISHERLESLEALESRIPDTLISDFGNLRPLQDLNQRQVYANVCG